MQLIRLPDFMASFFRRSTGSAASNMADQLKAYEYFSLASKNY
tara:strand:- start:326 stop:454 length:129 start_codon:yes stop_codon:yes gene_type:complete